MTSANIGWPEWDPDRPADLAKYASEAALIAADLGPSVRYEDASDDPLAVAASIYDRFAARRIRYSHEPWTPGPYQRLRSPQEFLQTTATCVDLAVAFAAACHLAGLRSMLVVSRSANPPSAHALVALDISVPITANPAILPAVAGPGLAAHWRPMIQHGAGVIGKVPGRALPDTIVGVDIVLAASGSGQTRTFAEAFRSGDGHIRNSEAVNTFIDLLTLRSIDPDAQLGVPLPELWPPIHSRLVEPAGGFIHYPSRASLEAYLIGARGRIVLHGASGLGKSKLAFRAAAAADSGYGWFLDASDRDTLISELADAERAELEVGADFDRANLADRALTRLRNTSAPWVVVLDNANCAPESLGRFVPKPGAGQTLIVTTTEGHLWTGPPRSGGESTIGIEYRPQWADGQTVAGLPLTQLDEADMDETLPSALAARVEGTPLLSVAVSRGLSAGVVYEDLSDDDPVGMVWCTCAAWLDDVGLAVAETLAWAPAKGLDEDELESLGLASGFGTVRRSGLAEGDGTGRIVMHRRFRAFARGASDPGHKVGILGRLLTTERLHSRLISELDQNLIDEMTQTLDTAVPASALERQTLGRAWIGLARTQEYRGKVKAASDALSRALNAAGDTLGSYDRAFVRQGMARWIFQNSASQPGDVDLARLWLEDLKSHLNPAADYDQVLILRADALDLLLRRKATATIKDRAQRHLELRAIMAGLQENLAARQRLLERMGIDDIDDIARGLFNIASTYPTLGLTAPDFDTAVHYQQRAREEYRRVRELRQDKYGHGPMAHVASCIHGEGVASYNTAVALLQGRNPEVTLDHVATANLTDHLRKATQSIYRGLNDRASLDGRLDGVDSTKSLKVLMKAVMLRLATSEDSADPTSDKAFRAVAALMNECWQEVRAEE
jgi:hypothetical protein